jgi:hypothetical protein
MNTLTIRDIERHMPILSWILIIGHAIFLAIGAFVFMLLIGIGAVSGQGDTMAILTIVAMGVAALMTLLALPGIAAGYGLLRHRQWGRVLGIIVTALGLLNFPIGTTIGIYALWVLFQQSANEYFAAPPAHHAYS